MHAKFLQYETFGMCSKGIIRLSFHHLFQIEFKFYGKNDEKKLIAIINLKDRYWIYEEKLVLITSDQLFSLQITDFNDTIITNMKMSSEC